VTPFASERSSPLNGAAVAASHDAESRGIMHHRLDQRWFDAISLGRLGQ
jgi:hypothetical protein